MAAKCIKSSPRLKMRLFAVCGTGCRRAWRPRSRARRLPARRRRCLSLTTRKRRLTGCCLPRMKKRRWRVCARFVSKRRRITRGSATSRPWKGPVACRPAWPSACCPPASACIVC
ncbi:hypothetical protein KPNJ1_03864 [Klebsiella pneumoniae 30660/NJST258_1]|uniref:Uncharacterized protein n=1 Tax=Klebsiella pneumoniae 30684/NJST258_2 TaxID=1420013 RepID=W8VHL9_KLEPN|nr:hypothetical protein KPNJ2_03851 [Klebsiella pneumoniae 30684/NJST258_2]AHM86270.1 hypothetical protein KPNJ1_03864 [Klebsiella pneumoniae 30660/NJST258_1]